MQMHQYLGSDSVLVGNGSSDFSPMAPGKLFSPEPCDFVPAASLSSRAIAYVIDVAVLFILFVGIMMMTGPKGLGTIFILTQSYFLISELAFRKSIGKRLVGLEVVSSDLSRATAGQILGRAVVRPLDDLFGGLIGLISIAFSDENQRVGDRAAKTIVVQW